MSEELNSVPHSKYREFGRGEERGTFEMIEPDAFSAPSPEEIVVLVHKENPNNWSMAHWKDFAAEDNEDSLDRIVHDKEKYILYRKIKEELPKT